MRRTASRTIAIVGAAGALLTACSSSPGSGGATWVPSPAAATEGPGGRLTPIIPVPVPSNQNRTPGGGGSPEPSQPQSSGTSKADPDVVATNLTAPVGLTLLPDGSALVGERTTGRIVRVQPKAGRPVPTVRTLTGLDTAGDGGLLDLALSPTYAQDNLIYAYITTATDNRVVDFTLTGPVTPVLTGIPKGSTDNTGRIAFGADGDLYVGTGDAGHPTLAPKSTSLAGKVLRVNDIGDPAAGNPTATSPVFTSGHRVVNGLCAVPQAKSVFEVETGAATSATDDVNLLVPGEFYGWPATAAVPSEGSAATLPAADRSPGGCAVLSGNLWVTSLDGQALLSTPLIPSGSGLAGGKFRVELSKKYGRLKTVVAAADGALWLTTSNRDGHGKPVAADERVIRWVPQGNGGGGSPV
jgi:glucose/arabinose dehydrogenase